MQLQEYEPGTRVQIGDRVFRRTTTGSFWREEHRVTGNCVDRPTVSLVSIEESAGIRHLVLSTTDHA